MFYSFLISHINEKSKLFNVWVEQFVKNMRLDPRTNLLRQLDEYLSFT